MPSNTGTTFDTDLSSTILASLALGTLEMREQLVYNPQTNTLTSTVFLVQPGSPIPTPTDVDITSMTLATYSISVDRTYTSCSPVSERHVHWDRHIQHRRGFRSQRHL